ncbi:MAG: DNA polymerase III subunit alpha [Deltaproteobacteria bacterium]|nr:DNA polymerase III subunit alpha [Deltaproteobacteria bacterium]
MSAQFVHLHFHTHYSLLDGANKIDGLDRKLLDLGYQSCAITDHGNLHGAIEFHHTMKKASIKPIIGMEAYVAKGNRRQKNYQRPGPNAYHTILLCENKKGYQNLIKLASFGFMEGKYYGKARIDHELLEKYNEGLIVLSACLQGELSQRLLQGNYQEAMETAKWYSEVFDGRYYIEIQSNGLEEQDKVNPDLIRIAKELDLPLVGTNDCHYPTRDVAESHYILQLMGWQKRITDQDIYGFKTSELFIKSPDEMKEAFKDLPEECIINTVEIAERCDVDLSKREPLFPKYTAQKGSTLQEELIIDANKGLEERLEYLSVLYRWSENEHINKKIHYQNRLDFELKVINQMDYPGYFLIVADFINWSKKNNIPVGPGRGSGAGSLVAYVLKITDIDPIYFDLLFERFLNPERISMPDFDIDFEVEGREKVIEYVKEKYGEMNVCQISAIGSLQAKGAIRGVARVLDFPYADADRIAKLIPDELNITIDASLKKEPRLKELLDNGSENEKKLLQTAMVVEGLNNNLSTHAAGIIIMNSPVYDIMPVCTPTKGEGIQSMYTMKYAEDQGAVKFDFLGLRNLTVIDRAVTLINSRKETQEVIDISMIQLDDAKTYQLLSRGETTGVFQLESAGMKNLIQKLKPDCFEDIIALVALYRPGPLGSGMVEDFVERKHGRQKIRYLHPLLEPILNETCGVMIYQEQVMRAVQVLAGFSLGAADVLRRAIGKKEKKELAEQRGAFIAGCKENDVGEALANEIFDLIDKFAQYGFNKSHSAAYAMISYQTAWLKANYPVEFMAALLTTERSKPDSIVKLISECREMKIPVLPPDINESELIFTALDGKIRFGLEAIKNVGASALTNILEARQAGKGFKDLIDFFTQIDTSKVNVRVLEALIKGGVFDSLEPNRRKTFESLETLMAFAQAEKALKRKDQVTFYDFMSDEEIENSLTPLQLPDVDDWKTKQRLIFEKETLGFFISGHPLTPYNKEIQEAFKVISMSQIKSEDQHFKSRDTILIAGVIVSIVVRLTKENKERAIMVVEDLSGILEVLVFPKVYQKVKDILNLEEPVLIAGQVRYEADSPSFIANKIQLLKQIRSDKTKRLLISYPDQLPRAEILSLKDLVDNNQGECSIWVTFITKDHCQVRVDLQESISISEDTAHDLEDIIKTGSLEYQYGHQENSKPLAITKY